MFITSVQFSTFFFSPLFTFFSRPLISYRQGKVYRTLNKAKKFELRWNSLLLSVCFARLTSMFYAFFFFFLLQLSASCTIHGTWTMQSGIWTVILKVNSNQKIIFLLFSVFNKISGVQTHTTSYFLLNLSFHSVAKV